jgi:hypothetical protein
MEVCAHPTHHVMNMYLCKSAGHTTWMDPSPLPSPAPVLNPRRVPGTEAPRLRHVRSHAVTARMQLTVHPGRKHVLQHADSACGPALAVGGVRTDPGRRHPLCGAQPCRRVRVQEGTLSCASSARACLLRTCRLALRQRTCRRRRGRVLRRRSACCTAARCGRSSSRSKRARALARTTTARTWMTRR